MFNLRLSSAVSRGEHVGNLLQGVQRGEGGAACPGSGGVVVQCHPCVVDSKCSLLQDRSGLDRFTFFVVEAPDQQKRRNELLDDGDGVKGTATYRRVADAREFLDALRRHLECGGVVARGVVELGHAPEGDTGFSHPSGGVVVGRRL